MVNCKKCNKEFKPCKGLISYCSLKCRNSRTRTLESKLKTSLSMKNSDKVKLSLEAIKERTIKSNETRKRNGTDLKREKIKNCTYCNKEFNSYMKENGGFPTLCSDECFLNMKKYNAKGIKRRYYNGLKFDSGFEVEIAKFLDENKIKWEQPKNAILWVDKLNKQHRYYADFYLSDYNIYLDPKNPYCIKMQKEKLDTVSKTINLIFGHPKKIKEEIKKILRYRFESYTGH